MKLKYLGKQKRDGSYPSVQVGKEFVKVIDGFIDVSEADAVKLIATKNFKVDGKGPTAEELAEAAAKKQAEEQAAKDAAAADQAAKDAQAAQKVDQPLEGFTVEEWNELTDEERTGLRAAAAAAATVSQAPDPVVNTDPNKAPETAPEAPPAQPAETPAAPAAEPAKAANPAPAADDKAALLARAKELGVPANASWGIPSLKKAIAKAEAK
jgi:hypothetical protein